MLELSQHSEYQLLLSGHPARICKINFFEKTAKRNERKINKGKKVFKKIYLILWLKRGLFVSILSQPFSSSTIRWLESNP